LVELRTRLDGDWGGVANWPEFCSDFALLRFVRGYHHDLTIIEKNVRLLFQFLQDFNAAEIRKIILAEPGEPIECYYDYTRLPHSAVVLNTYPERFYHGNDCLGNPFTVTNVNMLTDPNLLMEQLTPEQYLEYRVARLLMVQLLLHELSERHQKLIRITMVWDLNGFKVSHYQRLKDPKVMKFWGDLFERCAPCFPEIINKVIVFNLPWFLNAIWKAVKLTIPRRFVAKVVIFGSDISGIEERGPILLEDIPSVLGGKSTVPIGEYRPPALAEYYYICKLLLSTIS